MSTNLLSLNQIYEKDYQFFIGLDVSKDKIDYCITTGTESSNEFGLFPNTAKGINGFIKMLSKKVSMDCSVFCLENTGIAPVDQ
jgi:hypothetical protein